MDDFKTPELTEEQREYISWIDEDVAEIPYPGWVYRIMCFLFRKKKMTYKDLFLLIYGLNKKRGEKQAKEHATNVIINIYKMNNNKLPEGIDYERT